jgi:hypothetical protein
LAAALGLVVVLVVVAVVFVVGSIVSFLQEKAPITRIKIKNLFIWVFISYFV